MQATLQPMRDASAARREEKREREERVGRIGSREIWSIRDIFEVQNYNLVLLLIDINSYNNM